MPSSAAVSHRTVASPIGELTLEASAEGLRAIHWGRANGNVAKADGSRGVGIGAGRANKTLDAAARQLAEYFAGRRRAFRLPLDLQGTAFQRAVWLELLEIPYGETASYADVARAVGNPRACRAVGGANRRNPIPIVVPCHRVIGATGELVGYAGRTGLPKKARLLALENPKRWQALR